ncbi:MarR family transcriptional regulator [Brevibacillus humidisoli]|uniref:MarR family winged helix-turn-helix transcriptional regulator n=1 Tax=Brevibacillus humidisoli TaxID=2895522 RepID=UPI001E50FEBA|nr:MarR family transcriptional regulator [Brevibacillus humidisoli]UFJ42250.1 MarR family transcriptional regulator [Brevibacillus humidisoli]
MEFHYSDALTHLMGHVLKLHRENVDFLIQAYDVYPGQPPLLMRLVEKDGQVQKELASRLSIKPATLTVMVNRMEKNGLVLRKPDPVDQRVSRVFLTDKGRRAAEAVTQALSVIESACLQHVDEEEKRLLRRLLQQMYRNLEEFKREQQR